MVVLKIKFKAKAGDNVIGLYSCARKENCGMQEKQKQKSIFSVAMFGEMRFYRNVSGLGLDELYKAYCKSKKPFVDMARYGEQIRLDEFAAIQQSDSLDFSIEFDADEGCSDIFVGKKFESRPIRKV